MSEKYSTEELAKAAERAFNLAKTSSLSPRRVSELRIEKDAIIARLRAADADKTKADKLCEAARTAKESQGWDGNNPDDDRWKSLYVKLRKAIAEYEGRKEDVFQS
jgi:hypothetical protein